MPVYNFRKRIPTIDRFWLKVRPGKPDECWEWQAKVSPQSGYGGFKVRRGCDTSAHRFAWEATYGPIPAGLFVLHRCDNRVCCNPGHLFLGTQADNIADMMAKGRHVNGMVLHPERAARGERAAKSKLTWEKVREIRLRFSSSPLTTYDLADIYGVSQKTIWCVVSGKTWKEITDEGKRDERGQGLLFE